MKTKTYFKLSAMLIAGIFCTYGGMAQTAASGTSLSNTCSAGTTGTTYGCNAGASNTDIYSVFIGPNAGYDGGNTYNTAVGYNSGYTLSSVASYNCLFGYQSGYSIAGGSYNCLFGYQAGYNTGSGTTIFGYNSMYSNTANYNIGIGYQTAYYNTSGAGNVDIGLDADIYNTTGNQNTIIGYEAGLGSSSDIHQSNTFLGYRAGYSITTGSFNVCVGDSAGWRNTTGGARNVVTGNTGNVFVGYKAGATNTTEASNTCIGSQADIGSNTYNNVTSLGYGAVPVTTPGSDYVAIGNTSVSVVWCQPGVWSSDRRIKNCIKQNVPGLAFINLLQPVTFHLDIHKENSMIGYPTTVHKDSLGNVISTTIDTAYWPGKYDIEKIDYTGLIAQQVDSAARKIGYDFSGVSKPKDTGGIYGLSYAQFVVPLIKAVQELSHKVDSLSAANSSHHRISNSNDTSQHVENVTLSLPDAPTLGDAQPNPNSGSAQIPYYLPQNTTGAEMIFTDMLGNVMKKETLQPGYGMLNVDTQGLPSGVYVYTLTVNGSVIDSKKMIRTK